MYVAIDVGGTKTLLAVLDANGTILEQVKFATPQSYPDFLETLSNAKTTLLNQEHTAGAAGLPGVIDRQHGVLVSCGNLDWSNVPVKQDLMSLFNCPFAIENDAKTAGLAEAEDIKNEYQNVLCVAIGTGIGIAHIVHGINDQQIDDRGGRGVAVTYHGQAVAWEQIASGSAIVREFGHKAGEINDPVAWQQISERIATGLVPLLKQYQPEVVVISGGVGAHFDRFGEQLATQLKQQGFMTPLQPARHAEQAVIYGCYQLLQQSHGSTTHQA